MKAAILSGVGFENVTVEEIPVPEPVPGQLLARVDAAAKCRIQDIPCIKGIKRSWIF